MVKKASKKEYSIFFSYSTKDVGIAKLLIQKIENTGAAHGVKVFLDERSMEGGDPISETIRVNIEECNEFIVLLSADSVKSKWVLTEISAAWALRKRIVAIVFKVTPQEALPIIAELKAIGLDKFDDEYLNTLLKRVREAQ